MTSSAVESWGFASTAAAMLGKVAPVAVALAAAAARAVVGAGGVFRAAAVPIITVVGGTATCWRGSGAVTLEINKEKKFSLSGVEGKYRPSVPYLVAAPVFVVARDRDATC